MADAGAGRHHAEVVERLRAPAQERVALAVALVLELDVALRTRAARPNASTCTEWSITRSTGTSGLIFCGSPPSVDHRVAHRREVDHRRHAGEVLHQHARRAVGDLLLGAPVVAARPRMRLEMVDRDAAAVLEAQQVLEQHLEREGQARHDRPSLLGLAQREIVVAQIADLQRAADAEAVVTGERHHCLLCKAPRAALTRPDRRTGAGCGSCARSAPRVCARYAPRRSSTRRPAT